MSKKIYDKKIDKFLQEYTVKVGDDVNDLFWSDGFEKINRYSYDDCFMPRDCFMPQGYFETLLLKRGYGIKLTRGEYESHPKHIISHLPDTNNKKCSECKDEPQAQQDIYYVWFKDDKYSTSDGQNDLYFYVNKHTKETFVDYFAELPKNDLIRFGFTDTKGTYHNVPVYKSTQIFIEKKEN
jgi:hypothetical protein